MGTPSQKIKDETNERLNHIEALLQNKNNADINKFTSAEGLQNRFPLGFGLFYSDGRKILYYVGITSQDVSFDPATIKLLTLTEKELCLSGFSATIKSTRIYMDSSCIVSTAGSSASLMNINGVKVNVESLERSAGSVAWVIGLAP
jgi:hypothetical protein